MRAFEPDLHRKIGYGGGLLLVAMLAAACSRILGLDDIGYDVGDAGSSVTPGTDGAAPADEASDDGGPVDAAPPGDEAPAPVTVATSPNGAGAVQGMAIDGERLYWVTAGSSGYVLSVLKDGGGAATIATGQPFPLDIAVNGTSVYWSVVPGGVGPQCMAYAASVPGSVADGGDAGPTCVTSSADATMRMTLGAGGLVLLARGAGPMANDEYIGFATPGTPYTSVVTQGPAQAIAATTQQGFVGDSNGFHLDEVAFPSLEFGAAVCTSNCGGTVIEDMITDVAVQNVLWITQGGGVHTGSIHVNDAVGTQFVVLPATPQRMARDARYVYVTTSGEWVYAVPLSQGADGGVSITLSSKENAPFGIVVDDDWVYWGNADGTIRRTSVPAP